MKRVSSVALAAFPAIQFTKKEVLATKAQTAERQHHLLRAMLLNYQEHQLVKIYFRNNLQEILCLECAVIAVTDEHVMLKSGPVIPVKSIVVIDLL